MKKELRQQMLERREQMPAHDVAHKSEAIYRRLVELPAFQEAKSVMIYVDFRGEVMTGALIARALKDNKQVAVPFCRPGNLLWAVTIDRFPDDLAPGRWGILEPRAERQVPIAPALLDLVIVPALALDRQGYRLGYGAGYYDRFLPALRQDAWTIALAYQWQIVDHVPCDGHDVPLKAIVTEQQLFLHTQEKKGRISREL
ncbi:5-formyltetrahydrofolate cyclo-ligase [Heliophilum fasciatum]|nr:5-formyltetrahydrofolate cyclo-ligase [Heliophilum fasciatum]